MKAKKSYLKYIAIALAVIFAVSAALILLEMWEKRQNTFPDFSEDDGVVKYNGKEYVKKDKIETFLVLGLDKYEGDVTAESHEHGVQADFLMLFVFNNETKQTSAIHINRDSMTKVNKLSVGGTSVVDSYTKQIALAYNYVNDSNDKIRCRNTKDSVEYLLNGIKVDHYLSVTMDFVSASSELVGGVEVTVLDDFTGIDDTLVKGEKVTLSGERALTYVRTRYGLEDNTNGTRMARQQQYINALYDKIVSRAESDGEFLLNAVATLGDYVTYDSSGQRMQEFAEKFKDYEFLGVRDIAGETKVGEFVEFYPDENSVCEIVLDLFYKEKDGK